MSTRILSNQQFEAFQNDGYLIDRGFFDREEADILARTAKATPRSNNMHMI